MKDIIILAMGITNTDCPFDVDEVWGVNTSYRQVYGLGKHERLEGGHLSKIFICHRGQEYDYTGDPIFDWDELKLQVERGIEIVSLFDIKELRKRGIPFTRMHFKTLAKKFDTEYYSDTIAYQIAYALHLNTVKDKKTGLLKLKEPMRIRMYGVDMYDSDGYSTERGGVEYYVAIAKTLGVDFWIHPDSVVCKTETHMPYGFANLTPKVIDIHNVLELQKTPKGIKKLVKMRILDPVDADKMLRSLRGEGVTIREATDEDMLGWMEIRNSPEVYPGFYTQKEPLTLEEHKKWWESRNQDWKKYIIMYQEKPVGILNIAQLDHWSPEIGYAILPQYWGKGIGTMAVRLAIGYIVQRGKQYCHTTVLTKNIRSIRLLDTLGFKFLGEAREGEVWMTKRLS